MSHFAKVENGIVTDVIVAEQSFIDTGAVGDPSLWIQTSYNNNIRKRFAGLGYSYNQELDAFIPPKTYSSWTLNPQTADWEAPVPYPTDGATYIWDEATLSWIADTTPLPGV